MLDVKFVFFSLAIVTSGVLQGEPVCQHCQSIRDYNVAHHKNYEYYEDYLKDLQCKADQESGISQPKESPAIPVPAQPVPVQTTSPNTGAPASNFPVRSYR